MLMNFWGPSGYRVYVFTEGWFHLVLLQVTGLLLGLGLYVTAKTWTNPGRWRLIGGLTVAINALALLTLSRSWTGILLPIGTLGLLGLLMSTHLRLWFIIACLAVPTYMTLRTTEIIPTSPFPLRNEDGSEFLAGRGRSLNVRMRDERRVFDAVSDQPFFGTGLTHRRADGGFTIDGKWPIMGTVFTRLLRSGYVGLGCILLAIAWPALLTVYRLPIRLWADQTTIVPLMLAAATVLIAVIVNMLPNPGLTPVQPLLAGGLVTLSRRGAANPHILTHLTQRRAGSADQPNQPMQPQDWQRWAEITHAELEPPGHRSAMAKARRKGDV
jgi:hypothetical protein